jgi:hypothetical protein
MTITGWVLTILSALALGASAGLKFSPIPAEQLEQMKAQGFPVDKLHTIGLIEAVCVLLFLIPQTAVLGATLLSAYLGGAVFAHVRIGENVIAPIILGMLPWLGLYFRDPRVRALTPLRKV